MQGQKGHTMIETLIVLVITALLWTTALESFAVLSFKTETIVCRLRCRTLERTLGIMEIREIREISTSLPKAIDELTCPVGAPYQVRVDERGTLQVVCPLHQ
jgi:type II secretory pathway component PulJ